jgi:hypothetical protein
VTACPSQDQFGRFLDEQFDEAEQARAWLAKADEWFDRAIKGKPISPDAWNEPLVFDLLRKEAGRLAGLRGSANRR